MPWRLIIFSSIGYFVDLFDTFLVPSVRIQSLRDLGTPDSLSLAAYTTVLNWQLGGQVIGAFLVWGPAADYRGRRKVLLGSILLYSLANFATAFVTNTFLYSMTRLIAGIGLGGELGAAVTLIAEALPGVHDGRRRSIATMVVGSCGMLGVVGAAALSRAGLPWRSLFIVGGFLGVFILLLRIRIRESILFRESASETKRTVYSHLLRFRGLTKLVACILVGAPSFLVCGLLVPGAPEFARAIGMMARPDPSDALIWTYLCIAIGDILCGGLSSLIGSRKGALIIFHVITFGAILSFYLSPPISLLSFYLRCGLTGIGLGYWGNMVLNAAEQFTTSVRGMATIAVPNCVRFLLFPISASVWFLVPKIGFKTATLDVAIVCSALAVAAISLLPDGAKLDLKGK
jgi:putative MFS transporter